MTTAVVFVGEPPRKADLVADLESAGVRVLELVTRDNLVQQILHNAPDLVICYESRPDDELFDKIAIILKTAPRPVVVFTTDSDADTIGRALECGIHAYVVNGYAANRLRTVIHLARARFRQDAALRQELAELGQRFHERKLVDRAKGILMRARQISEDDAFKTLRSASMHSNRRMGSVSQQVIESARYADAVNRSGQLRMLSQRLVKLYALCGAQIDLAANRRLIEDSMTRARRNLLVIHKSISAKTFGDLLQQVDAAWDALQVSVTGVAQSLKLIAVDALAEALLESAERLTNALETAGLAQTLHVINLSGRQRMLSQRLAKQALLGALVKGGGGAAQRSAMARTVDNFNATLKFLNELPLSTKVIRSLLAHIEVVWAGMLTAIANAATEHGQAQVAAGSEELLTAFDSLTDDYERSMQMLVG